MSVGPWMYPADPLFGIGALGFTLLVVWSGVWKGIALWKAARNGSVPWFILLLIVNTLGILEILYIYVFSKKGGAGQYTQSWNGLG